MAFSYSFKWLPLLLAAASLITIASADQALINSICAKARNHALCYQVLNSVSADRGGLGQISTNVALGKAQNSLNLAKNLAKKASDPRTKEQYKTCLEVYGDALDNLKDTKTSFGKKDFGTANIRASAAYTDVDTCSDEGTNIAPELKAANQENEDYIDIVLAVSNVN
ncbi:PMEI domain-containing protein [Heracleum sosnowskyi]|uniref:PMEI domain-containing protein n=1 Tax=Heracleum sosnowskyi TaxID=360622 RepID=A0AAD8ILQ2_9APIA|nr:PMEI domain-containing protein [Heracleum sosnowskyi]